MPGGLSLIASASFCQLVEGEFQFGMIDGFRHLGDLFGVFRRQLGRSGGFARRRERGGLDFHLDRPHRHALTGERRLQTVGAVADFVAPGGGFDEYHQPPRGEQQRLAVAPGDAALFAPAARQMLLLVG